jgi:hypothetical protein
VWLPRSGLSILVLIAVMLGLAVHAVMPSVGWQLYGESTGPDSRRYGAILAGFMDHDIALVRQTRAGVFGATYETVTKPRRFTGDLAHVVRPTGQDDELRVYFGSDGLVLGLSRNECWAAWDSNRRRELSPEEIGGLSPFVLLDSSTQGCVADIDAIVGSVERVSSWAKEPRRRFLVAHPEARDSTEEEAIGDVPGDVPSETSLLAALDSSNPWVRSAAKRLVEAGGTDMYPDAARRIAAEPK